MTGLLPGAVDLCSIAVFSLTLHLGYGYLSRFVSEETVVNAFE